MARTSIPRDCECLIHRLVELWQRTHPWPTSAGLPHLGEREITKVLKELVEVLACSPESAAGTKDALARSEAPPFHLTMRERDVLCWLAKGKTVSEVGMIMQLSACTVRTYIQRALKKLDVSNRTHAVSRALRFGLIDVSQ